jgi:alpha-glucosidase
MNIKAGYILLVLFLNFITAHSQVMGNCRSYEVTENRAIFHCDNNTDVMLQQNAQGIIKIWYSQTGFHRNNQSFAVINETAENKSFTVDEQPSGYTIYTGDLIIRAGKAPFRLTIYDKYQKVLLEEGPEGGYRHDSPGQSISFTLRGNEHFLGLGEKTGVIDRRGKSFRMWNSDKPCYSTDEDPIYKSIPFFMSSYGYGILLDNTYKTDFDFGKSHTDRYSLSTPSGEMVIYFIYGPSYKQIIERYIRLTGKAIMPPEWALGFSQCRGLYTNEKLARDVAAQFRKRQIPCDVIYQDIGWTQYLQDFNWRKENYANPRGMVADLAAAGFKMIVSQDPVISRNNVRQWTEADSLGYFTTDIRTGKTYDMPWPWGGNCGVVDFTNPAVADWWGAYQQKAIDDGVKGFWTDMGEPAWSNEESGDRLFMKHHAGMHDEIHNVYGLTWNKVVTEQLEKRNPNRRPFQMTRASFAGMQRYTFGWSGDSGNGDNVLEGWEKLAAQIPVGLSAGMGLIPFWTCDISGYCGDITDYSAMAGLYVRWMQFGIFNPLSRAHHEGNNAAEPWLFGPQAEQLCREAINLKYKLHPYIYTYAREAYDTGMPLMRALPLEYPADETVYGINDQFMFGRELLVAPVVEKDATSRKVYLPQGEWIDFNDGKTRYQGKQWISMPVTLGTIPMFVKSGSVIAQMPVMQYIGEKKNAPVIFDIYPPAEGRQTSFTLYEDDGETDNYKRDVFGTITVTCRTENGSYTVGISRKNNNGWQASENKPAIIRLHSHKMAVSVTAGGQKIKASGTRQWEKNANSLSKCMVWTKDEAGGTCSVFVPAGENLPDIVIRE